MGASVQYVMDLQFGHSSLNKRANKVNIQLLQMKKGSNFTLQSKVGTKSLSQIKFNLSDHNLACFKGKQKTPLGKAKIDSIKQLKYKSQIKASDQTKSNQSYVPPERNRAISCTSSFNETVVIMQYDNIDVYIDKSTQKKSNSSSSKSSTKNAKKSDNEDADHDQFLQSCVRVITEQTDNTSNPVSLSTYHYTPPNLTPRSSQYSIEYEGCYEMNNFYQVKGKLTRNRQSVTIEESKRFIIDEENIQNDQRTTVMVKNIPNKYTQEMLLEQFTVNYENKFDFFYLPIDKDNDCNVGYAFVNFVNTAFLRDFYRQFHGQKWKKYKSPKICNICYARYQGTLQLADHFKHTKIMNQKDRKIKPLIGISQANRIRDIKDIKQIIKNQRNQQ